MRHWILMFKPETYEVVQSHGVVGVQPKNAQRFFELAPGDKFITYVSRARLLDGHGEIRSEPFNDVSDIGPGWPYYALRARVRIDQTGAGKDAKDLLWGFSTFDGIRTSPGNYLFCKGGFLEIAEKDYRWARSVLDGSWKGPPGAAI